MSRIEPCERKTSFCHHRSHEWKHDQDAILAERLLKWRFLPLHALHGAKWPESTTWQQYYLWPSNVWLRCYQSKRRDKTYGFQFGRITIYRGAKNLTEDKCSGLDATGCRIEVKLTRDRSWHMVTWHSCIWISWRWLTLQRLSHPRHSVQTMQWASSQIKWQLIIWV